MKAVSLLINSLLPEDLQDDARIYDKGALDSLLADVARKHPSQYSKIVKGISDIGRNASYLQGETLTLNDMRPVFDKDTELLNMDSELAAMNSIEGTDAEKQQARHKIWFRYADDMEKRTLKDALSQGNNLGSAVVSKARGNPFQLKAMLTTPALYTDYKERPIDLFVRRSYGEGLRPYEYLASTYGVRKGVISTKASTADAGDLAKQAVASAASTSVTEDDCGTTNGIDMEVDDQDMVGRVLAHDYGKLEAGTVIDKHVMGDLRKLGVKKILARSPMTCSAKHGICAHCLGTLPTGKFVPLGYSAGITAAQAITEPLAQGALNCLVEGTLVRMADGTIRAIENICIGEYVLGADIQGRTFPVQVEEKWDQGIQPCQRYMFHSIVIQSPVILDCTSDHPILSMVHSDDGLPNKLEKTRAADAKFPMIVRPQGANIVISAQSVENIGPRQCWDLTVACEDHLFVLANGLIVKNTKHGGGGFTGEKKTYAGFDVINQLVQSPETFPFRASVSEQNGRVEKIEDAPQGGKFVFIGGEKHYVLPGMDVSVKAGDEVEKGDQLSDGIVDVADIVRLRGLGEGRRYYVDRMKQALEESGAGRPSKLNLEVLARASLDHVNVNDPDGLGDYLPDDVASYNRIAADYSPPIETKYMPVENSFGHVLEAPVLHYTIGTRLTPKMTRRIKEAGISNVSASMQEPKFSPEMSRLRASAHSGEDWLAKTHTSYIGTNLQHDAERGRDTNVDSNVHFAPRLMKGVGFGVNVEKTGEF